VAVLSRRTELALLLISLTTILLLWSCRADFVR
jgi:hypothetical protein